MSEQLGTPAHRAAQRVRAEKVARLVTAARELQGITDQINSTLEATSITDDVPPALLVSVLRRVLRTVCRVVDDLDSHPTPGKRDD